MALPPLVCQAVKQAIIFIGEPFSFIALGFLFGISVITDNAGLGLGGPSSSLISL